ncbi:MAG: hypothetical protein ACYC26_10115 [Phycisphaerales bacterium]
MDDPRLQEAAATMPGGLREVEALINHAGTLPADERARLQAALDSPDAAQRHAALKVIRKKYVATRNGAGPLDVPATPRPGTIPLHELQAVRAAALRGDVQAMSRLDDHIRANPRRKSMNLL